MSPERKITRHIIPAGENPAFMFLGVVSSEPDYRLSVLLNRHLRTDLRKNPSEITVNNEDKTVTFSNFTTVPPALSLVSNHSQGITLLNKLKNIDFLIVIHGEADKNKVEELAARLRKIPEITAVFVFDSTLISDRNVSLLIG
jgi:hypothetical protein